MWMLGTPYRGSGCEVTQRSLRYRLNSVDPTNRSGISLLTLVEGNGAIYRHNVRALRSRLTGSVHSGLD